MHDQVSPLTNIFALGNLVLEIFSLELSNVCQSFFLFVNFQKRHLHGDGVRFLLAKCVKLQIKKKRHRPVLMNFIGMFSIEID